MLRRLRGDAGVSLETAAAKMDWHPSKLSRIENAKAHIRVQSVAPLLNVYGVTDPGVVSALEGLARDASKTGWWQTYSGVVAPAYVDYISLESDAESIRTYAPLVVPGLLQTAAYARAVITANAITRTSVEVAALVEVRLARQAVLSRPDRPLKLWAIVEEAVLHRHLPDDPNVMDGQLQRLLEVSHLPGVTLQVVPLDAVPHPGGAGAFDLVSFPHPMPGVVEIESLHGSNYVEGTEDVTLYESVFNRVSAAALSEDDSLTLIHRLKKERNA
jgi:transcriptional regulator with XRE-family HTH domain